MIELVQALWRRQLGTVERLLLGQMIMFIGIAAVFPVAPLYVASHHGGSVAIAAFIAGPMVANTLVQLPAGRLVDRLGPKRILIGSRLIFAAASFLLFADFGALWWLGALRCLQGAASGAYIPAVRVALAETTEPGHRTERFAQMQAVEMVGLLIGPALGGAVALWRVSGIFLCSGVGVLFGVGPLLRLPRRGATAVVRNIAADGGWWRRRGILVPAVALIAAGALVSMYDVVWPQYMTTRGYNSFIIGISISLYAVPILLLAGVSGRIGDRTDRRVLMAIAFGLLTLAVISYPSIYGLGWILGVGAIEACAEMLVEPNLYAIISDHSTETVRGRAMGMGGMFEFAGGAFGAGVLGALYGVNARLPFYGAGAMCLLSGVACVLLLPGRSRGQRLPADRPGALDVEVRG